MEKKLILISNDDSVNAPGLHFLVDTIKDMGEIWVVAPDEPKSGQSSSLTFNAALRITEHEGYENARLFSVSGTPVDCVKLAMHNIVAQARPGAGRHQSRLQFGQLGDLLRHDGRSVRGMYGRNTVGGLFAASPFNAGRLLGVRALYQEDYGHRA